MNGTEAYQEAILIILEDVRNDFGDCRWCGKPRGVQHDERKLCGKSLAIAEIVKAPEGDG